MVSAFHIPDLTERRQLQAALQLEPRSPSPATMRHDDLFSKLPDHRISSSGTRENDYDETEDEEVKMSCVGGVQEYMTSSDDDCFSNDDDDSVYYSEDESDDEKEERGVVSFITRRIDTSMDLIRPRPMLGGVAEKANDDSDSDASHVAPASPLHMSEDERESAMADDKSTDADDEGSDNDEDDDDISISSATSDSHENNENVMPALKMFALTSTIQERAPARDEESAYAPSEVHTSDIIDKVLGLDTSRLQLPELDIKSSRTKKRGLSKRQSEGEDFAKRMRCSVTTPLTELFLGASAYDASGETTARDPLVSPFSSSEATDQNKQLSDELWSARFESDQETSPVPLFSPPSSPLCFEVEQGGLAANICEWPSNLAVDTVLNRTPGVRANSPSWLLNSSATTLTPVLQGIRVNQE